MQYFYCNRVFLHSGTSTFTQVQDLSTSTFTQVQDLSTSTFTQVQDLSTSTFTQEQDLSTSTLTQVLESRVLLPNVYTYHSRNSCLRCKRDELRNLDHLFL